MRWSMGSQFLIIVFFLSIKNSDQSYVLLGNILEGLINLSSILTDLLPTYPDSHAGPADRYDFIIIGSGPSGSVLANRLSENRTIKILLLENGEEASFITDIPIIAGALGPSKYNYGYRTEAQPGFCRGCFDQSLAYEHGNALGGSTIINYMLHVRGNRRDYDRWAALGNPGWAFQDLLPYFKKIEYSRVAKGEEEFRGKNGYLTVSDIKWNSKIRDVYVKACEESGYKYVDYNGAEQLGVSNIQATISGGKRCSAEKAYLRTARHRKNLKIKTKSKVTKILVNSDTKTAIGVEYYHNKRTYKAYASKEVILSAGSLNSPHLLMLSGIGPRDQLEPLGIPIIKELPVGKKMYDHANFPLIIYSINESITVNSLAEFFNPVNYILFGFGSGVLTSPGGVEALTYVKVNDSSDPDPLYPDIELLMVGGTIGSDFGLFFRKMFNIPPKIFDAVFKPLESKQVYQVTPVLLHPKSYGNITLKTKSPFDPPKFYANFLDDPQDVKIFIAGIREFQRINAAPSLQKYGATLVKIPVPGCEKKTFDSDSYWECALRTITGSYFHQVSTCKMGPSNDTEAIVDNEMKVYGINNLRVMDTSVIPLPLSAHTAAIAYVIGEKGADLIKQKWNI